MNEDRFWSRQLLGFLQTSGMTENFSESESDPWDCFWFSACVGCCWEAVVTWGPFTSSKCECMIVTPLDMSNDRAFNTRLPCTANVLSLVNTKGSLTGETGTRRVKIMIDPRLWWEQSAYNLSHFMTHLFSCFFFCKRCPSMSAW